MLDPSNWGEARRILELLLDVPAEEREAILARECSQDDALLEEVRELLEQEGDLTGFLTTHGGAFLDGLIPEVGRGVRIGDYEVRRVIASGGMGSVYEAHQDVPNRTVALKVMRWSVDSDAVRRRFRDEVEILGRMRHPAIAQVYGAGTHRGRIGEEECEVPYFAMELVEDALPLTRYVQRHALPLRERLRLFQTVCDGIQHGHQRGIIHRDLKPANLLVDAAGFVKVIDFGVARLLDDERSAELTRAGEVVGTLQYMSPEQLEGRAADVDTRTDVYSLGVVLYELLCDVPPFDLANRSLTEVARVLKAGHVPKPSARNASCATELDWIVAKAMDVDPERRYASASELRADIERYLAGEPVIAGPPSRVYKIRKFVARHRVLVVATSAVLLSLSVGLVVSLSSYLESERLREDVAEQYAESERLRTGLASQFAESEALRSELATQLDKVREAERVAKHEVRYANDVNRFFADILGMASPEFLGPDATIQDAVDRTSMHWSMSFADEPERRALIQAQIGKVFLEIGNVKRAIPELRQALDQLRELRPSGDEAVIDLLIWMGRAAADARAIPRSREFLDEAYRACEERGPDDPLTLRVRHQLGSMLIHSRQFDEAETILRDTLERRRRVLGETDETVFDTMELLATSAMLRGDVGPAVHLIQETYLLRVANVGETHVSTVRTMGAVVAFLRRAERWDELAEVIDETLETCREVLGERHLTTSSVRQAKAALHEQRGEFEDALAVWKSLEALRTELLGDDHPSTMSAMHAVGKNLVALGRLEEATAQRAKQLEILRKSVYGERHEATYLAWKELTDVLLACDRHEVVANRLTEVLTRAAEDLPATHEILLGLQRNYVLGLAGADRLEEAVDWLTLFVKRASQDEPAKTFHQDTIDALVGWVERKEGVESARLVRQRFGE